MGGTARAGLTGPPLDTPDTLTSTEQTVPPGEAKNSPPTSSPIFFRQGGEERIYPDSSPVPKQLVVPQPYISKVLFMARSHLLGAQ